MHEYRVCSGKAERAQGDWPAAAAQTVSHFAAEKEGAPAAAESAGVRDGEGSRNLIRLSALRDRVLLPPPAPPSFPSVSAGRGPGRVNHTCRVFRAGAGWWERGHVGAEVC